MSSLLGDLINIVLAVLSLNSFAFSDGLSRPAAYVFGAILVLGGGYLVMRLVRAVPALDKYLERSVLVTAYLTIAAIIFVEVIRRFVFKAQVPWSTTLPPYLFLIMAWVGCSYNAKLRTHLSFSELRLNMGRSGQLSCLCLDAFLWLAFALIVVVTSLKQTANSAANFQILLGTDNVMQWWFYAWVPASWVLLSARIMENLADDFSRYRNGAALIVTTAISGD